MIVCVDCQPCSSIDRIEDPDASVRRIATAGEIPVRQRGAVQIGGSPFGEIFGIDLTVVALDEGSDRVALRGRNLRLYQLQHLLEVLRPAEFGAYCHPGRTFHAPADHAPSEAA